MKLYFPELPVLDGIDDVEEEEGIANDNAENIPVATPITTKEDTLQASTISLTRRLFSYKCGYLTSSWSLEPM